MNRKIITSTICLMFLTLYAVPVMALGLNQAKEKICEVKEKLETEEFDFDETTAMATSGSIKKAYTKVEIIDGDKVDVNMLNKFLNRKFLRPILPVLSVTNLTFSVEYLKTPDSEKFGYLTFHMNYTDFENFTDDNQSNNPDINELVNNSLELNTPHKIIVENFTGIFYFKRARLARFMPVLSVLLKNLEINIPMLKFFEPAYFTFIGYAQDFELIKESE